MKKGCAVAVVAEDDRPRQFPTVFSCTDFICLDSRVCRYRILAVIRNTGCRHITGRGCRGSLPSG